VCSTWLKYRVIGQKFEVCPDTLRRITVSDTFSKKELSIESSFLVRGGRKTVLRFGLGIAKRARDSNSATYSGLFYQNVYYLGMRLAKNYIVVVVIVIIGLFYYN
jgi:hypothetical protein